MFLTGPAVVREVTGEDTTAEKLGGPRVHERNGVCPVRGRRPTSTRSSSSGSCLGTCRRSAGARLPVAAARDPELQNPGSIVPLDQRRAYDVRDAARGIVDGGSLLEVAPRWAPNLVTAFARIDGSPVGIVANQPRHLGGVLDADAGQKGARFVRACNAFRHPARRARRHARVHAGSPAGVRRP